MQDEQVQNAKGRVEAQQERISRTPFMVFSVYEKLEDKWHPPFIEKNIDIMKRSFVSSIASKPEQVPTFHIDDKDVYVVGLWFPDNGQIEPMGKPELACPLSALKEQIYHTIREHMSNTIPMRKA